MSPTSHIRHLHTSEQYLSSSTLPHRFERDSILQHITDAAYPGSARPAQIWTMESVDIGLFEELVHNIGKSLVLFIIALIFILALVRVVAIVIFHAIGFNYENHHAQLAKGE